MSRVRLSSRFARQQLPARCKPYFESLSGTGVQLGYRTRSRRWLVRWWLNGREIQRSLQAFADDQYPADGIRILNHRQAVVKALERAGQDIDLRLDKLTVAEVFKRYTASRDAVGKDTRGSWLRYRKWIEPDLGSQPVSKLRKAQLVDWRDKLARNMKPASVNRTMAIFKACLRFGIEELEIPSPRAPIWKAFRPLPVVDKARKRFLRPAELSRLANAADPELRPLILAASFTGARFGDLAALTCGDWHPDLRKVRIRNAKTNRPRYVPVNEQGAEFFDHVTANGARSEGELMLLRFNGGGWKKNTYRRQLLAASERARISPPVNFHMIRHSYASAMKMAGVDDTIIAAALGHASTRMVQEHYGHLEQSHIDAQIKANALRLDVVVDRQNVVALSANSD